MAEPPSEYDAAFLADLYRRMQLIRRAERALAEMADGGETPGAVHLCIGQEAVAAGACAALREADVIGGTHRSHGHALAKGADLDATMAEFAGKETGLCGGRGGDMHLFDPDSGVLETTGIIGANAPHVAGAALSASMDPDDDRVGVSFFGDGAANQGVVFETLNMAAVWDLPVVFVCEDNGYAITTPREQSTAGDVVERARGFDVPAESVDGQDVLAVHGAVSDAVERARAGAGPGFVHCETYRYTGHFSWEDDLFGDRPYRSDEEVDRWRERDPIRTFRERLLADDRFDAADLDAIDEAVAADVERAVAFAEESPDPDADRATETVYADGDYPTLPAPKYR